MLAPQAPVSGTSEPGLRSGLYVVRPPSATNSEEQLYIVYWPQDTTWNDNAPSADRRNRVTFMRYVTCRCMSIAMAHPRVSCRYLTKICDQIVALVSHGDAESIVWHDDKEDDAMDDEEDESDRLFTFEVEKTKEQEENVTTRPGFQVWPIVFSLLLIWWSFRSSLLISSTLWLHPMGRMGTSYYSERPHRVFLSLNSYPLLNKPVTWRLLWVPLLLKS